MSLLLPFVHITLRNTGSRWTIVGRGYFCSRWSRTSNNGATTGYITPLQGSRCSGPALDWDLIRLTDCCIIFSRRSVTRWFERRYYRYIIVENLSLLCISTCTLTTCSRVDDVAGDGRHQPYQFPLSQRGGYSSSSSRSSDRLMTAEL